MEHFDAISRDPLLRREKLERWIESDDPPPYAGRYVVIHTSGSSGNTGIFVHDRTAWTRTRGTVMARAGFDAKPNPFRRRRMVLFAATHGRFGAVTSLRTMPRVLFDVRPCSVLEPLARTIETLNDFQPEVVIGYAASLHALANAAIEGRLAIRPTGISSGGEVMTDEARRAIEKAWDLEPMDMYATSESGSVAIRRPGEPDMQVMEDEHVFEMLDDAGDPVAPGEVGRVVLTVFANRAMPLIRYEMGDYVTRGTRPDDARFDRIQRIEGRVNDALPVAMPDGGPDAIHPIVLSEFFVPGAEKFQFVSEAPGRVRVRYLAPEPLDAAVSEAFAKLLDMKGARPTTRFAVERADALPVDAGTGKYKLVVRAA